MIVINSNMMGDSRLSLVTSSNDFLATADYPLRPSLYRTWRRQSAPPTNRRQWCYFPKSFPVYRMQRMISIIICLLVMVLLSLIGFVLVQVGSPHQLFRRDSESSDNVESKVFENRMFIENEVQINNKEVIENDIRHKKQFIENENEAIEDGYRKHDSGLGLKKANQFEKHIEYKRSLDEKDYEDEDYADDDDEFILDTYQGDGNDDQDDGNDNPVFDMNFFDFSKHGAVKSQRDNQGEEFLGESNFKTPEIRKPWKNLPNRELVNSDMKIIENGIIFSAEVETLFKNSELTDRKVGYIQHWLREGEIKVLEDPTWERCGRPKNQWLKITTGEAACARYRYPDDYLLSGEVLSFYLSRLLRVGHVPPVVLSQTTEKRWTHVQKEMTRAGWGEAPVVVLTPWIQGLVRDYMPSILLAALTENTTLSIINENSPSHVLPQPSLNEIHDGNDLNQNQQNQNKRYNSMRGLKESGKIIKEDIPVSSFGKEHHNIVEHQTLRNLSTKELLQLLQWSDLVIFDYLTANYDRVVYMQDAADKDKQTSILKGTIHNLVRSKATDALWLLDNESGLIDAYSLLYSAADSVQSRRFQSFHKQMLETLCIFRKSTIETVLGLYSHPEPHTFLVEFAKKYEPLFHFLPDPQKNSLFMKYFPVRVKEVHDWISKCSDMVKVAYTSR